MDVDVFMEWNARMDVSKIGLMMDGRKGGGGEAEAGFFLGQTGFINPGNCPRGLHFDPNLLS